MPQPAQTSSELQRKTVPFSLKTSSAGDTAGTFSGICSVFNNVDYAREIIAPGAFSETLPYFLSEGFVTYEHEWDEPIGRPTNAEETAEGLVVTGEIYPEMFEAASVLAGMKRGVIKQMSIGYYVQEAKFLSLEETVDYWKSAGFSPSPDDLGRAANGVTLLTKLKLEEAAICMRGANNQARVTGVKGYLKSILGDLFGGRPEMQSPPGDQKHIDLLTDQIWKSIRPAIRAEVSALLSSAAKPAAPPAKALESLAPHKESAPKSAGSELLRAERLLIDIEVEAALGRGF